MTLAIRPLTQIGFAAEVEGVDLRSPLSAADIAALQSAIDEHGVLVFHRQQLTDTQQADFSQQFGELELPDAHSNIRKSAQRRISPALADISNLDRNGALLGRSDRQRMFNLGNRLWHSDSSFRATPSKYSLLSARSVPDAGGETQFADMRAAYDALDTAMKAQVGDLVAEHSLLHSRGKLGFDEFNAEERAAFAPVRQALVRAHPATGRRSLYLSAHAGAIVGWPLAEARLLLQDLTELATRPEHVYTHRWVVDDLVWWDNRQTMHRARPFDDLTEERDMRRTTIRGTEQTAEQAADRASA